MGLFPVNELMTRREINTLVAKCGACGLYKGCQSPKMKPSGKGRKKILVVGEAPGRNEDERGKAFVGDSGMLIEEAVEEFGGNFKRDCLVTNALICRPPGNAKPKPKQIDFCRPNLFRTIKEFEPDVIIPMGKWAVRALMSRWWKQDTGPIGRWVGFKIPLQPLNCWVCPNFHPSYVLRQEKDQVLKLLFKRYLAEAFELEGKPWETVPDYTKQCVVYQDPKQAARHLGKLLDEGKPLSFDYETNTTKPDSKKSRIVCCSVSDGETSIAYPWLEPAIGATADILFSHIPKFGANIKFENRHTYKHFGKWVKNFCWDIIDTQHMIDNRRGICSVKFQAMTYLGLPVWNKHVEPYFTTKGGNQVNRINEIDKTDLLLYCAIDSLVEHKIAEKQMEYLGFSY